jgi:hypothetical protein
VKTVLTTLNSDVETTDVGDSESYEENSFDKRDAAPQVEWDTEIDDFEPRITDSGSNRP